MSDDPRDPQDPGEPGPDEAASSGEAAGGEAAKPVAEPAAVKPPAAEAAAEAPAAAEEDEAAKKAAAAAKAKAAAEAKRKAAEEKARIEAAKPPWERDAETPEWEDAAADPLAAAVAERFGAALVAARSFADTLTLEVETSALGEVAAALKSEHGYTLLVDIAGADYPDREPRFDVVYQLHSLEANRRIRLRVKTDEATPVPTVCGVWRAANWPEREVYDMYGVRFDGHPDMTRILLWEGFNGYPLRKDFPVEGIDTGSAIYPEYYESDAGPVAGTGTGWKAPEPPAPPAAEAAGAETAGTQNEGEG